MRQPIPSTLAALLLAPLAALPAAELRTTPLVLKDGGTAENPAVFDGQGMIIDLAIDVTDHPWKKEGDRWTSNGPLKHRVAPVEQDSSVPGVAAKWNG